MEEKIVALLEQIAEELKKLNGSLSVSSGDDERTMFPEEAAQYLGIKYDTLLRWAREGIVPSSKPGGQRVLFRKKALDEFLAEQENRRIPKPEPRQDQQGKLRKIIA